MAWSAITITRLLLFATLGLLAGLPVFERLSTLGDRRPANPPASGAILTLAILAFAVSLFGFAVQVASMTGTLVTAVEATTAQALLDGTALGLALKVRCVALIALIALAVAACRGAWIPWWLRAAPAMVALASLAWSGHGAATPDTAGWIHLGADIVHLAAAAVWISALCGFLLLLAADRRGELVAASAVQALTAFASVGTTLVVALIVTGGANLWYIVDPEQLSDLISSDYGKILALKLALFALMIGLASLNRFYLTPLLAGATDQAKRDLTTSRLRWSIGLEFAAGAAVLSLVAWLGTLAPAA